MEAMKDREPVASCPFCSLAPDRILLESAATLAFFDGYPVSEGHTLVIPKRHVASIFDLSEQELIEVWTQGGFERVFVRE